MRIGSVAEPGPVVKLAITRSSSDSVNASIQPAAIAGRISGRVTAMKAGSGSQARSIAASREPGAGGAEPRLHDDRDEAQRQRGMRNRHRPEAALGVERNEQQE